MLKGLDGTFSEVPVTNLDWASPEKARGSDLRSA
jgi:hypothetical protein